MPNPLLFGAYLGASGENRVTEVLATVLDGVPQFVAQLAAAADLPAAADYSIQTQARYGNCVPDLEIRAIDISGETLWIIWSEHKKHSPFSLNQLTRYAERLKTVADGRPSRLIAVTLWEPSEVVRLEAATLDVPLLRWRHLVQMAESAGKELGGPAWRTSAGPERDGLAPRLLREWIVFCERELEEDLVEPLTQARVDLAAEALTILITLDGLVEHALTTTCLAIGTPPPKGATDYWWTSPPSGSWAEEHKCSLYLKHEAEDTKPPVFAAGMWTEGEAAEALRSDAEVIQRFVEDGCRFWDDGTGRQALVDISVAVPMSDIAVETSLEDQQRNLAAFCERVLGTLSGGPGR